MAKVALLVLFNHRYDKNLPLLDEIYRGRFDDIYYIMPFYDGDRQDVIPVYGRSVFFQGYIAQAYNSLKDKKYDHYLIVADDMVINPKINQDSYLEFFSLGSGQSFIPMLRPLHEMPYYWIGTMSAFTYSPKQKYVESVSELPPPEAARELMARQGIEIKPLSRYDLFKEFTLAHTYMGDKLRIALRVLTKMRHPFKKSYTLRYPLVGSYSDFLIVSGDDMKRFAHYCGVFSSTSLFVEVAIPSALVLAAHKKIMTEKDCKCHGRSYWAVAENVFCESPRYTWEELEKQYKNLDDLLARFPEDAIYIHPIKLSKWISK